MIEQPQAGGNGHPTLADYWAGTADFKLEVPNTGLPMGESETITMSNGELWSYVHASDRSAGVVDQCGAPVDFPGCTVIYKSYDSGNSFTLNPAVCQFECTQCPCDAETDHHVQQQYPRIHYKDGIAHLIYEYLGRSQLRTSSDGQNFSPATQVAETGIWYLWYDECPNAEFIGDHPFVPYDYECLAGGPPGIYVDGTTIYTFLAVGQSPSGMGCYKGQVGDDPSTFVRCDNNPLFSGSTWYGPRELRGAEANPYWDFRYTSSAAVQRIGNTYYMLYEGIRGPGPGDPGDTQFGLGLARTTGSAIDSKWEIFGGNPILVDLPGNIGLGHGDIVVVEGQTIVYTSLDGEVRSRLALVWK